MMMQTKLLGYTSLVPEQIVQLYEHQGAAAIRELPGNFIVTIETPEETTLISSAHGVCNYFYTVQAGQLFHGDTVANILRESKLPWRWDWQALADVALLEQTLDNETLHPAIQRLPPATILRFSAGRTTLTKQTWEEVHPAAPASADQALQIFNAETARWFAEPTVVSMSGGFDSRVILASMLHQQLRPDRLLTLGFEQSTDVQISVAIAKHFNLPLQRVELEPQDYLRHGARISALTNGTKPAGHWHTHLYTRKANLDPTTRLYIGSNGEFCRSFLLDKGIVTRLAGMVPGEMLLRKFWSLKFRPPFHPEDLASLHPEWARYFAPPARQEFAQRAVELSPGGLLPGLDHFYLRQRVRHFIANGLKLYADSSVPITPFLNVDWTREVWNLPRKWKQGSNWHRFAIARNCPELLNFPEEKWGPAMPARAPALYWARAAKKSVIVPYHHYGEWFRAGPLWEFVRENAGAIDDIIDPQAVVRICDEHRRLGGRERLLSFFMMLCFWKQHLRTVLAEPATVEAMP